MNGHGSRIYMVLGIGCVLGFLLVWAVALNRTVSILEHEAGPKNGLGRRRQQRDDTAVTPQAFNNGDDDNIAKEIPGIELSIPPSAPDDDSPIQVVYANEKLLISTDDNTISNPARAKGLVLLLHACSHSALKFFSPSPECPNCAGLSEELRIVRLVLERGYVPVAVSSLDRKNGCWGGTRDVRRIEDVLKHDVFRKYQTGNGNGGGRIYGMGASSGGAFVADLATRGIVEGALVMVMQLSDNIVNKIRTSPIPIYLAPMPNDANRMKRVMQNYRDLQSARTSVVLDTTNCDSFPVTIGYLMQRVPGMTVSAGETLLSRLKRAGHIDPSSNMLRVDPTRSDWRKLASPTNSTHFLDEFVLAPGFSPLAKALHRAWAFHEYCSEAVVPALSFFERHKRSENNRR